MVKEPEETVDSIELINEALKREEEEASVKQARNRNRSKKKKGKKGGMEKTEMAAEPPQPPPQADGEAQVDTDDEMPEMLPLKKIDSRVFRKARKIKGKYCVCTLSEKSTEGTLHFNAYSPGSSVVAKLDLDAQKLATLLSAEVLSARFAGDPQSKRSSPQFCVSLVNAIIVDLEAKAGYVPAPESPKKNQEPVDGEDAQEENADEAEKHKQMGNDRFRAKDASGAFAHYESAVMLSPRHLVYQLNCAAALLEMKEFERAIKTCKTLVSACRSWQYRVKIAEKHSAATDPDAPKKIAAALLKVSGGTDLSELLARAYARIGSAYRRQGKIARATNAFLLSLKETESAEVRKQLKECYTMAAQAPPAAPGQQPPPGQPGMVPGQVPDMEDFLQNNQVVGYKEKFKFECTGCGECCRSSDHIMLSPYDLFRMTREPNMATLGVQTTWALRQHNLFKEALKYTLRNGLPVCFLRPARNTKQGHCHFAYPIHKYSEDDSRKDKAGKLLTFEEVHDQELVSYEPVRPEEYNLTEEEEEASYPADGAEEEEEESEEDSAEEEENEEEQEEEVEEPEAEPQLNSYGKQALACMFGVANMPTMCATYPMAREISWADFWHEHGTTEEARLEAPSYNTLIGGDIAAGMDSLQLEGESGGVTIHTSRKSNTKSKHAERLAQSKYVMVRAEECEGFYPDGKKRTDAFPGAGQTKEASESTIEEFLHGESHIAERYDHNDWFLGLIQRIVDHGTEARMESLCGGPKATARPVGGMSQIRRKFMETLAKVWYNFDALKAARTRPFKSWARLQKTIEEVSWSIVSASDKFVRELEEMQEAAGEKGATRSEKDNVGEYEALLVRLRI
jgi:hypothetical protein